APLDNRHTRGRVPHAPVEPVTMNDETTLVTLDAIRAAQRALPPQIVRTPLLVSEDMGEVAGAPVWFKAENLQVTGSYKARATFTMLNNLPPEQKARGAAISSSGNFAAGWAAAVSSPPSRRP